MAILSLAEHARLKMATVLFPFALRLAEPVGWNGGDGDDGLAIAPALREEFGRAAAAARDLMLFLIGSQGDQIGDGVGHRSAQLLEALRAIGTALAAAVVAQVEAGRFKGLSDELFCICDLVDDMIDGSDCGAPEIVRIATAAGDKFGAIFEALDKAPPSVVVALANRDLPAAFDIVAGALHATLSRLYERGYGATLGIAP